MTEPRKEVLHHAAELITGDRNKTYGSPTQNFEDTAAVWTVQLRNKLKPGVKIDKSDVALLMIALKLVREIADHKADNWVDIAGYAGCGYECAVDDGMRDVNGWKSSDEQAYAEAFPTGSLKDEVINHGDPEPSRFSAWRDTDGDVWTYHKGKYGEGWCYCDPDSNCNDPSSWEDIDIHNQFPWTRVS